MPIPALVLFILILPLNALSQTFSINAMSETLKLKDGGYKVITRSYTNDALQASTVKVSPDLKTLKFSFYSEPFQYEKQVHEGNQEKVYFRSGHNLVILNLDKWLVSFWNGEYEDGNQRFIHYHLSIQKA